MLYGKIKPTMVKITKRIKHYEKLGIPSNKPLMVLGYDMNAILLSDARVLKAQKVRWQDVELVECERIVQVNVVQSSSRTGITKLHEKHTSIFDRNYHKHD